MRTGERNFWKFVGACAVLGLLIAIPLCSLGAQQQKEPREIMNHGRYRQQSVQYLSRSLGRNAREALSTYDLGWYEATQFHIQRTTEHCIACHSRLPSGDSPLAADFVKGPELAAMDLRRVAQYRWRRVVSMTRS